MWQVRVVVANDKGQRPLTRCSPMSSNYGTLKGTVGEIQAASKMQGRLAKEGKRISKVADELPGTKGMRDAGDILVVTKGRPPVLAEILDVKKWNWNKNKAPWQAKRVAKKFSKQYKSLSKRYAKATGKTPAEVRKMFKFVLLDKPPKSIEDALTKAKVPFIVP